MTEARTKDDWAGQNQKPRAPVGQLLLDRENPRIKPHLSEGFGDKTVVEQQRDLLRVLWDQMAVDEIAMSVGQNGWFDNEELLVTRPETEGERDVGEWVVIEGNRRLAAVRLLLDPALAKDVCGEDLRGLVLHGVEIPDTLPYEQISDRQRVWQYLGFEHVNGAKPWGSYSKAAYVARVHEDYGVPLDEIARSIGDRHSTVKRLYRGYAVLEQAETSGVFNRDDCRAGRLHFSHLYTAVNQPTYADFLAIDLDAEPAPNPVPETKLEELGELMNWLFGSKSNAVDAVVKSQNPDLNRLRSVLADETATQTLRDTRSLSAAYAVAYGEKKLFRAALADADRSLRYALSIARAYEGDDEVMGLLSSVEESAASLRTLMEKRQQNEDRKQGA